MAKFMHQMVMKVIRVVIQVAHYIALNYDEVSIVDNQSWLFVYYYMVENWVRIPILICLERVVAHSRNDNLTNVIMEALMIDEGLPLNQTAQKFICFGVDGVNVFQGTKTSFTN
jgi:hypothetical protein